MMEDLVRSMISMLDTGNEEDICAKFQEFNKENARTFSFDIDAEYKKNLIRGIIDSLAMPRSSECHAQCLETLRILSREKFKLYTMAEREGVQILLRHAGLDIESVHEMEDKVTIEAQKCLCNLVFNSDAVQRICSSDSTCVEAVIARMKLYKGTDINADIKFFDMRLLFLLTALCSHIRPRFGNDVAALLLLLETLESTTQSDDCSETDNETIYHMMSDRDANLAMEVLKTLFNVSMGAKRGELDEEEETLYVQLGGICRALLLSKTSTDEKTEELQSHTVNLLTNMPNCCIQELTPECPDEGAAGGKMVHEIYLGRNIDAGIVLKQFLEKRLERGGKGCRLVESLTPILSALHAICKANKSIRKHLRNEILPPLRDASKLPEEGETIRNRLVRLMTNPSTDVKDLVADLLFVLCKENVDRLVKYTGYGNAAGLLCQLGLMAGGHGDGDYSTDEESDTEEYLEVRNKINPITGRVEEDKPDPTEGWTEEQKEFHANQLANMFDKLSREGVIQPMKVGPDGRPVPIEEAVHQIELPAESSDLSDVD
ncbi:chaperone Ric-8A-like [Saccoglossus kowalevskii]|uniref:Synembryn-A-like n=1 Tax=Saccoglossus kowalevskii TaxID=10224 RepID=A0ABM0GXQ3_SACKO|nr:PREDICTED: synembryn-A-like [Saccoglossus kowalevskii]